MPRGRSLKSSCVNHPINIHIFPYDLGHFGDDSPYQSWFHRSQCKKAEVSAFTVFHLQWIRLVMGFFWDRPFLGILISDRQKLLVPTNKPLFFFVAIYITLVCCARYRSGKQSTSYLHPIPPLLMPFIRLLVPWMPSVAGISTSIIAQKIIEHGRFPQMYLVKTWTRYIYIYSIYILYG